LFRELSKLTCLIRGEEPTSGILTWGLL